MFDIFSFDYPIINHITCTTEWMKKTWHFSFDYNSNHIHCMINEWRRQSFSSWGISGYWYLLLMIEYENNFILCTSVSFLLMITIEFLTNQNQRLLHCLHLHNAKALILMCKLRTFQWALTLWRCVVGYEMLSVTCNICVKIFKISASLYRLNK